MYVVVVVLQYVDAYNILYFNLQKEITRMYESVINKARTASESSLVGLYT